MKKNEKRIIQYYKKIGKALGIFVFVLLITSIVLPKKAFSEKENRVLQAFPKMDISSLYNRSYESKVETYVNDHFPLRDFWVNTKAFVDTILGKKESNDVYKCSNGYLIEKFKKPSKKFYTTLTDDIIKFSKEHKNVKEYALIAPTAINIYSDKLPLFAPVDDQNYYLNEFSKDLSKNGITFIDIRNQFLSQKNDKLYYKTDHHWTTKAAYIAFLEVAKALNLNPGTYLYEAYPVTNSFQGTLSAKSGFESNRKEEIDVYLPKNKVPPSIVNYVSEQKKVPSFYNTEKLKTRDKYGMFFNGNHPLIKIQTPVISSRVLLIFKDSYGNSLIPFLAPYFSKIIMVDPRYYYGNINDVISVEGITDILYLYNANTFFSDNSLALLLQSAIESAPKKEAATPKEDIKEINKPTATPSPEPSSDDNSNSENSEVSGASNNDNIDSQTNDDYNYSGEDHSNNVDEDNSDNNDSEQQDDYNENP